MKTHKINEALAQTGGNISAAARLLGVPRSTLSDIVNRDRSQFNLKPDNSPDAITYKDEVFMEGGFATVEEAREALNLGEEYYADTYALNSSRLKDGQKFVSSVKFVAERPLKDEQLLREIGESSRKIVEFKPTNLPKSKKKKAPTTGVVKSDHHAVLGLDWDLHETSLEFMRDMKVQNYFDTGDLTSFDCLGRFAKSDERWEVGIDKEFEAAKRVLGDNASVLPKKGRKEIILGNHEDRYNKWLLNDAPRGFSTVPEFQLEYLFGLDAFGFEMIHAEDGPDYPYAELQIVEGDEGLVGIHGHTCRKGSGNSVRQVIEKYGKSVLMGHVHDEASVSVMQHRKLLYGFENASMAQLNLGYAKDPDHAQGFSFVTEFEDGTWNLEPVRWDCKTKTLTFRDQQWRA